MPQTEKTLRTVVLVLDQSNTLSFAAAVDPMRAANRQARRQLFDWRFATPTQEDVRLTSGLVVPANPVARIDHCDFMLVVGGFDVAAQTTSRLCASLSRLGEGARIIAGVDGGPWVLAQSGLLDGARATTHWEDLEAFAQKFPQVETVNTRYQIAGHRMTSAGAAPTIDMMLTLIEQEHSATLARKVAGGFVLDHQQDPARPQMRGPLRHRGSRITARAHEIMEQTLDAPLSIAALADAVGTSTRALQLQFQTHLQTTPQRHYLMLRLTEAQRLVMTSHQSLHEIALATGFASQSSFARAYSQRFQWSARAQRTAAASKT